MGFIRCQLTTSMMPPPFYPTASNIIFKEGAMVNLLVGTHLSSHKLSLGNLTLTISPRTARIQDINLRIIGKSRNKKGAEKNGVSANSTDRNARKITNQPNQTQPPSLSPLPSPNPKGGINVIHSKKAEGEEDEDENEEGNVSWWYDLLAQLVDSDDEEDKESEDESEEEDEDESTEEDSEEEFVEEEDQTEEEEDSENEKSEKNEEENHNNERTSIIATLSNDKEIKEEVPVKCEDPGPCLVTCKIKGVEVQECLCDPGACSSVMPYELDA
ncbi:hypothetical protein PIB30_105981 [Stylosanthes scabra]|uniref:Uncharacterized protein n=1 Tax=Stylosanthes scabra TaxID=79078 RepID=A0ABU6V0V7_9FABA|nr:hypothetical protein [Stylosanthes scabra]